MSEDKKKWYQDPDGVTKIAALVLLLVLLLCLNLFAGEVLLTDRAGLRSAVT